VVWKMKSVRDVKKECTNIFKETLGIKSSGFTLVELIVVICLSAILAGAFAMNLSNTNDQIRLNNAAERALADMRYAQEVAMAQRREVNVVVNASTDQYSATFQDDGSYLPASIGTGSLITTFNEGEYQGVAITSSGLGGTLSFTDLGAPEINGSAVPSKTSVMCLNSEVYIYIYSSGFSDLE